MISILQQGIGSYLNQVTQSEGRTIRYLLSIMFLIFTLNGYATDYYVSSSDGNDANSGTSPENAWKTLNKVNSFSPKAGDQILFNRGDEWVGSITVKVSGTSGNPIVYGAYGTGESPKIFSSKIITGWTQHSGNIYKATVSANIEQLFLNGKRMKLARYPNKGYFKITNVNSSTQFASTDLSNSINYTGATWIGRTSKFTLYHRDVTSSSSQTITLESAPTYGLGVGEGFFLADKFEFLDSAREWYYNSSTNTIYLWTPNGDSPDNYTVRGSVEDYGFYIANKNYITIKDIEILHSSHTGIYTAGSTNITVDNSRIISPDQYGIYASASGHTYTNNYIYQTGSGIRNMTSNATITDNTVEDIGLLENINKRVFTHDNYGTAIYLRNGNPTVHYNRIINAGYCGINWKGDGDIKYNYINGACQVLDDGGGIYTYNGSDYSQPGAAGSEVKNNIVLNVYGNREGYTDKKDAGHGIYMDNNTHDVIIQNNIVAHVTNGIFLHQNGNILVESNTVIDGILLLLNSKMVVTNEFTNNIAYATARKGDYTWWQDTHQRILYNEKGTAHFDRNTYISPYAVNGVFVNNKDFAEWQSTSGQDKNSTFNGTTLAEGETEKLFFNDTKTTKTINLGTSVYRDLNGNKVTGKFNLEPFTSRILIKSAEETTVDTNQSPVIQNQAFDISAPKVTNDFIGQVVASDPDDGQTLSYSIVQGNEKGYFILNASTGVLIAKTNIPNESQNVILVVEVTDNAKEPLFSNAEVTINITANTEDTKIEDTTSPSVTSFNIPSTSESLTVPVSMSAADDVSVTGWWLSETSSSPLATSEGWSSVAPVDYTFSGEGTKTLYAWAKDAAGNISATVSGTIFITLQEENTTDPDSVEYITICEGQDYLGWTESGSYERIVSGENTVQSDEGTNQIGNPSFSEGTAGWVSWSASGYDVKLLSSTTEYVSSPSGLQIQCVSTGTSESSIQVMSKSDITIEAGKVYILKFNAKATAEFSIGRLYIHKGASPWTKYVSFGSPAIKTSWNQYEFKFTASHTATDGSFRIYLGNSLPAGQSLYLDDVHFSEYKESIVSHDIKITTYLTVTPTVISTEDITITEGEDYLGWTQSGEYLRTIESASGCDSTITTNLTVIANSEELVTEPVADTETESAGPVTNPETEPVEPEVLYETEYVTICEGDNYNGLTEAGVYETLVSSESGSQIMMTTYLTIEATVYITETIKIWTGENYNGWTEPGHYERVLESASGCDSIVVTKLIVRGKNQDLVEEDTAAIEKNAISRENGTGDFRLENAGGNEFLLYPNPARTYINVEYKNIPEQDTRIEIIDVSGRTVHTKAAGSVTNRIDFEQLNPGMYYLRSVNKHSQRVEKFLIQ
jgi:hypothetical protein